MKKLADIIRNTQGLQVIGDLNVWLSDFCLDSRKVVPDSLFVAKKGTSQDGHHFIEAAIKQGAKAILCETMPAVLAPEVCYIRSEEIDVTLASILNEAFHFPSENIELIGVTGTNGKTTTTTLLFNLFENLGYRCGLISTVQNKIHDLILESTHTTPDIISLYKLLSQMVDRSCKFVFMEVSSHAIDQKRIQGLKFKGAVFTNITHDHLDYHLSFKNYINVKKKFFDDLDKSSFALVNRDDIHGEVMLQNTKAKKYRFGIQNMADYKAKILDNSLYGLHLKINQQEVHCRLIGEFNAYNILCVYAVAELLGIVPDEFITELSALQSVDGRFELIHDEKTKKTGIVDYAHTPDALEKILQTIQKIKKPEQSIITIIGCGGNRDKSKRPKMAAIAIELSDKVIFTADNPRDEDPEDILKDMKAGVEVKDSSKFISIIDREQAIKTACLLSKHSDIILVAGKGHEKYQEVKGKKFPFDDKEKLKTFLLN